MPSAKLTRDNIPTRLLDAKLEAVGRFLHAEPAEEPRPLTYTASARASENLVGIGVGFKISKGKVRPTHAVRFYVVSKIPPSAIPDEHLLPRSIGGLPTDVIETGLFQAFAVPAGQKRIRPAKPGCSIGFQFSGAKAEFVMAGTFGAVVADSSNTRYILSNNHVLANENTLPLGSPIFQPGLLDGGKPATDTIAALTKFIPIKFSGANHVDCAIAKPTSPKLISPTVLPKVGKLASSTPIAAVVGMKVHKTGRTTGYRTGAVFDVSADVKVGYDAGTATFQNQVLVRGDTPQPFSDSGDSGSMIVDRQTQRATALLFAGSTAYTIGNHMSDVLAALGVTLVT
ncbi:MAG TPA: hypothetical protein VHO06_06855 [Polyangia bacterium]|nr:hypothetical protein [Polyangia bacterium]